MPIVARAAAGCGGRLRRAAAGCGPPLDHLPDPDRELERRLEEPARAVELRSVGELPRIVRLDFIAF